MGSLVGSVVGSISGGSGKKLLGGVTDAIGITNGSGDRALAAQTEAANQANATQRYIYDEGRKDNQPWMDAGKTALGQIQSGMGDFQKNFSMSDFQQDPGYQFRVDQGSKALERSAAAKGGLNSGGTMMALARYGQDYASNEYSNAYNRYNNDRDSRFNKLSSLAGIGQQSVGQVGQVGQNYGNQVSANQIGLGNAAASNQIAQTNRMAGTLSQIGQGAAAFSDERVKTNIEAISPDELKELKETLKAYKFNYISPEFGSGDHVGVMAQDLEKSKLGKRLVFDDPVTGFKKIDMNKVLMLFLATLAEA